LSVEAHWSSSVGFEIVDDDQARLDQAGAAVAGTTPGMWVLGEGFSAPLLGLPDRLPTDDSVWPDVIVPAELADGTRLAVHTLKNGQIDAYVGDVVITARPADLPYADYWTNKSTRFNYCDANIGCGTPAVYCRKCSVCSSHGLSCGNVIGWRNKTSSPGKITVDGNCGNCNSGNVHHCYSQDVLQHCF
jgi:hypothetical protein